MSFVQIISRMKMNISNINEVDKERLSVLSCLIVLVVKLHL